jgi:hypothetical protein
MADAVNKIGALVGLMAVGGPLGLAIGAIAVGLAGVTAALEALFPEVVEAKDEFAEFNETVTDSTRKMQPLIDKHDELRKALEETTEATRTWQQATDEALASGVGGLKSIREFQERLAEQRRKAAEERKKESDERDARQKKQIADENAGMIALQKTEQAALDARFQAHVAFLKNRAAEIDSFVAARNSQRDAALARELADAQFLDAKLSEAEATRLASAERTAQTLGAVSENLATAIISNDEDIAKASVSAAIDAATASIVASAASGAAKAFESLAGVPIVGPALGAVAAGVVSAAILAFRSQVSLAQGGVVTGGIPGKDSVQATLMPGERVISKPNAEDPFRQQPSGDTYNINVGTIDATPAGRTKLAKTITREQRRNRRLGLAAAGA